MENAAELELREVEPADLDCLFRHQLDPEAVRMAAFVGKDPSDRTAFDLHWAAILGSARNINRTVVAGGQVAGHIAVYPNGDDFEVTYWLGREFWGRGLATRALERMLALVPVRPIMARAVADNIGSLRVLQKCGFKTIGRDRGFANGRGEEVDELILRLESRT
jgi:RimJ/RimL family protein N-acetyltransferase